MSSRRAVVGAIVSLLLVAGALAVWVRLTLGTDPVRAAIEAQLTRSLGQPVAIGAASAHLFPRVTLTLRDVAIGEPARIRAARLHVGASLRALLSRRIEHADIQLDDVHVELPLPTFAFQRAGEGRAAGAPVEIVSIDSIGLTDVAVVSGGRTLRADFEGVPDAGGLLIRRLALDGGGTSLIVSGRIADFAGPTGDLTIAGRELDVLEALSFAADFVRGAGSARSRARADSPPLQFDLSVNAERATIGTLALAPFSGRARVTSEDVRFDRVQFGVFGGTGAGTLRMALGGSPAYRVEARLTSVDVADAMRFAGSEGTMTGTLAATIALAGRAGSARDVLATAGGAIDAAVTNGTVAGLGLVRAVVVAGSMRTGSRVSIPPEASSAPEPFTSLTARLAVAEGVARTNDLRFVSPDLTFLGAGTIGLPSGAVDLSGGVQLSEPLTERAGRDLVRYTRDDGRVTLPVDISGAPGGYTVRLDLAAPARRAIVNRAQEEVKKAIEDALGRILK